MREDGFYWVKRDNYPEIAHWDADMEWWNFCGSDIFIPDEKVILLSGRLPPPED